MLKAIVSFGIKLSVENKSSTHSLNNTNTRNIEKPTLFFIFLGYLEDELEVGKFKNMKKFKI